MTVGEAARVGGLVLIGLVWSLIVCELYVWASQGVREVNGLSAWLYERFHWWTNRPEGGYPRYERWLARAGLAGLVAAALWIFNTWTAGGFAWMDAWWRGY